MKYLKDYFETKKELEKMFNDAAITELADIDWIISDVTGISRSMLPFAGKFSAQDSIKINEIARARVKHIPLAYITGQAYFFGRKFLVNRNVLIPRQDTEIFVERVLHDIKNTKGLSVLDIGTGSGVIAITLALELCERLEGVVTEKYDSEVPFIVAVDISSKAIELAQSNANNLHANVKFLVSDLFENLKQQKFDIIVSNPPYIETATIAGLEREVKDNEPILALDGGNDGLEFYRRIIADAPKHLNKGGKLYFEIGYNQAESVCNLMKSSFKNIEILKDYDKNDRVVLGELL